MSFHQFIGETFTEIQDGPETAVAMPNAERRNLAERSSSAVSSKEVGVG